MNALIVLAHPERASLNGSLADVAANALRAQGHQVDIDDLYGEHFDPVERADLYSNRVNEGRFAPLTEQRAHYDEGTLHHDVQRELDRLDWADLIIFQFPLWWHAQPAILKGWFDRVLIYGGRYSGTMRYDNGYFRGKQAALSVTTGSPRRAFQPFGRAGNIVEWLWPIHASLYYVGLDVLAPQVSYGIQGGGIQYQDESVFRDHLENQKIEWGARVPQLHQEPGIPFTGWEDWDTDGMLADQNPWRWRP